MRDLTAPAIELNGDAERPTRIRHVIVAVTVLMAVLLYLDRFCVSFAERYIKEDLGLTDFDMTLFGSLFFFSYALAQVPAGWLGDRFGPRVVLSLYILVWSFFTAMIGWAGGLTALLVARLGCGLGQAGAYPACGGLLSKWVPLSNRGLASALVALGGRGGAVIAPILTAYLMVAFVPLSTSPLLDESQLLNPPALVQKLAACYQPAGPSSTPPGSASSPPENKGESTPAEQHVAKLLPDTAQQAILRIDATAAGIASTDLDALVAGLNDLLRSENLYDEAAFGKLSIEKDALNYLERRTQGDSLAEPERLRMNRLLLEAALPKDIGKLYVRGWRPVLVTYGVSGLLVALVFWTCFRNNPAEHPWCNARERNLIDEGKPPEAAKPQAAADPLPMGAILRSGSLWLSSISQFWTNVGWLFLVFWLPRYLMDRHQVPILERSWMVSIPPFAGIAGMFLGGTLTDWLTRRVGLRWGRALPMGITRFGAAAAYVACLWIDSPWPATIAFACVFFFVDLGVGAVWAFMQDVGGKHVGSILGWGNMWGNFGAFAAPFIYNAALGSRPTDREWHLMFITCAAMFVVACVTALGIDASRPVASSPGGPRPEGQATA
jgi:MFS transporter, ACS family, glucarate transporter